MRHFLTINMSTPQSLKAKIYSLLLALYLVSSAPKLTKAEDSISYKYEDYQEDSDRIRVVAHYVGVKKDLGVNTTLGVVGLIDTITGSTPTGEPIRSDDPNQVPLSNLEDERKAVVVNLDHKRGDNNFTFEISYSDESDYLSQGGSVTYKRELNKNNTVLQFGGSFLDDELTIPNQEDPSAKTSTDFFMGVTQVVDRSTVVKVNLSYGREHGYLADPYKVVQKSVEILPEFFLPILFSENRPSVREKWAFYTEALRDFQNIKGSLQASYRYFHDTGGINSHTVALEWFQKLSDKLILRPVYRYYRQTAADFYHYDFDQTDIVPDRDNVADGPFYSSDHRLSHMETHNYGVKLVWFVKDELQLNLKFERYKMKGLDGVTHPSAYSDADILTVGGSWWF